MEISIFDVFDESILYPIDKIVKTKSNFYSKTKELFLEEKYNSLPRDLKLVWDKDKINPAIGGIILNSLEEHFLEVLNAIEQNMIISEKVLTQYECLRVLFFN